MDDLIFKYLNKNYRFTLNTYEDFLVKNKITGEEEKLSGVISSLSVIFNEEENEIMRIFDRWADYQNAMLYNRITEIREEVLKGGSEINLTIDEIVEIMSNIPYDENQG